MRRVAVARAAVVAVLGAAGITGCGRPRDPAPPSGGDTVAPAPPIAADAAEASQEERLAAIQKAMNELDKAAQQCWAAAATERFDIEGEITLLIDIAPGRARASVVHDTARNTRLSACLVQLMAAYRWAPPLYGQAIQLPFRFRAPDGQNTIDRALVAWNGQGNVSVAVLLDENNTGSDAASMFELAIAAGGTTGLRSAGRAELWYFLGAGQVVSPMGRRAVAAGDMMFVPRGGVREVAAPVADLHAMIAVVPGGREGSARGGALPTPEATSATGPIKPPLILPAAGAPAGATAVRADAAAIPDRTLSAAILTVPAGGALAEHVHAGETELLYLLAGSGTLTVSGVDLPVTSTSVVQIPKNTRHALVATSEVRAVQIFTPAPAKAHP
ncbi:MAG: cupin domain-containing protein [Deltaproteobacteria bacterium]|nr:MAG: cupin domain-containing protein [Deltaproteobacteria bacterium]TMQ22105.1 MAG: cupin domain-containing protein [Deltaproteobacteria bacterium]